jgi:hypothetical protein
MTLITWGGLFGADVPEDWTAHVAEGVVEIVPPEPVGALHVTVLRRSYVGPVQDGEAVDLLLKFGKRFGWSGPVQEVRSAGVVSAEAEGLRESTDHIWDVRVVVSSQRALVASYLSDGRDRTELSVGRAILASLRPTPFPAR